jgi:hypothetical protein
MEIVLYEHRDLTRDRSAAYRRGSAARGFCRRPAGALHQGARGADPARPRQTRIILPVWHLGGAGTLHRRDIYDDALEPGVVDTSPGLCAGCRRAAACRGAQLIAYESRPGQKRRASRSEYPERSRCPADQHPGDDQIRTAIDGELNEFVILRIPTQRDMLGDDDQLG